MNTGCSPVVGVTVAMGRPVHFPGITFEALVLSAFPIRITFFVGAIPVEVDVRLCGDCLPPIYMAVQSARGKRRHSVGRK
jgi:hypothetical protein